MDLLIFALGIVVGATGVFFFQNARMRRLAEAATQARIELASSETKLAGQISMLDETKTILQSAQSDVAQLQIANATLETRIAEERKSVDAKLVLVNEATEALKNAFKALSADALSANNDSFLALAQQKLQTFQEGAKTDLESRQQAIMAVISPLKESLDKVDKTVREIEVARESAYSAIKQQISDLTDTETQLKIETSNLVKALRTPQGRGKWGELQLRRLVEAAGMIKYCDFFEQTQQDTESGRLRPDMVVKLPGNRKIVVDAKTPLLAYLESLEVTDDEVRQNKLQQHASQVREHLDKLSSKAYWEQFTPTPEIVVMFLHAESIFSAALQGDPTLIEYGAQKQVIPATPTTLLSLLRAVHYGWRQEQVAENAHAISNLGKDLYERILTLGSHFGKVGNRLRDAVSAYNDAVGSLELRVLSGARKFKELAVTTKEDIKELAPIDASVRQIAAEELLLSPPSETGSMDADHSV